MNALEEAIGFAAAILFPTTAAAAPLPLNLARFAKATATSEFSGQYLAQFAVDGKIPEAGSPDDLSQTWCVRAFVVALGCPRFQAGWRPIPQGLWPPATAAIRVITSVLPRFFTQTPLVPAGRNTNSRGRQPTVRPKNTFDPAGVARFFHQASVGFTHGYSGWAAPRPAARSVAQTSKSAVSQVSKPASRATSCAAPIWKPAIRQVWKPAPRAKAESTFRL